MPKQRVILASASPRRAKLLRKMGLDFSIELPRCEEISDEINPVGTVCVNVGNKWASVAGNNGSKAIIIAADTVVSHNGVVFGKPKSHEDAVNMLMRFSGKRLEVYTALKIGGCGIEPSKFIEVTGLLFKPYDWATVNEYIRLVQPWDRAGSYDIDCYGGMLIDGILGSYSAVMGLPYKIVHNWFQTYFPSLLRYNKESY